MRNTVLRFRQSSIISEKPGYFSEKFKAPATIEFLAENVHMFPTYQCFIY